MKISVHGLIHRPGNRFAVFVLALVACTLSGCDFPTEVPRWDTRWLIPAEATSFSVAELLPAGIAVGADNDAFDLDLSPASFSRSLREMCGECVAAAGATFPKPAFTASFGAASSLPENVLSARLVGGEFRFRLLHDLSFDPLRPSATARGYLLLIVRSGSTVLARDSLDGSESGLPPGVALTRTLQVQPGLVAEEIEFLLTLHSPAGDPTTMDADGRLRVTVTPGGVQLSEARVLLSDQEIATPAIQLELDAIDDAVSARVRAGAVHLQIDNPFDVAATVELRITSATADIAKPLEIPAGTTDRRIELTGDELRSILGRSDVQVRVEGTASSPPEGTAVAPGEAIGLMTRLELVISSRED